MTNNELEKKISKAFNAAAPDVYERIADEVDKKNAGKAVEGRDRMLSRAGGIDDNVLPSKKRRKKSRLVRGFFIAAAAAAAAIIATVGITSYHAVNAVASTVLLDVNPSIEIKINNDNKVLSVIPRSDDAKDVIGNMDFSGANLDVAVNALLGSMISKGYLSEIANSILVSVDNADPNTASELQAMLMDEIDRMISSDTFSGAIIGQVMENDSELSQTAERYGITLSKAQLIKQITTQNPVLKFEDLVSLTINDLNLLKQGDIEGVSAIGTASDAGYIGDERAVGIALEDAGFSKDDTNFLKVYMDYENDSLCYEISFHVFDGSLDYDYDYDIEASTGKIISVEKELDNIGRLSSPDMTGSEISEEEAKKIAFSLAGVDESAIYEYELEKDYDRIAHYDIEFKVDDREYNYGLTMFDATVIKDKWEIEQDYVPGENNTRAVSEEEKENFIISEQQAKEIAFKHARITEASAYDIEIELEREKYNIIYEVEFKSGLYDYSYDIDTLTGEILDYELDFNV